VSARNGLPIGPSQPRTRTLDLRAPCVEEGFVDLDFDDLEYRTAGGKE
jgi:hypothetical protein